MFLRLRIKLVVQKSMPKRCEQPKWFSKQICRGVSENLNLDSRDFVLDYKVDEGDGSHMKLLRSM